jgi:hypothetical protein
MALLFAWSFFETKLGHPLLWLEQVEFESLGHCDALQESDVAVEREEGHSSGAHDAFCG